MSIDSVLVAHMISFAFTTHKRPMDVGQDANNEKAVGVIFLLNATTSTPGECEKKHKVIGCAKNDSLVAVYTCASNKKK